METRVPSGRSATTEAVGVWRVMQGRFDAYRPGRGKRRLGQNSDAPVNATRAHTQTAIIRDLTGAPSLQPQAGSRQPHDAGAAVITAARLEPLSLTKAGGHPVLTKSRACRFLCVRYTLYRVSGWRRIRSGSRSRHSPGSLLTRWGRPSERDGVLARRRRLESRRTGGWNGDRLREIDVVESPLVPFLFPDRLLRSLHRSGSVGTPR